jgi:hypothetical protein
MATDPAFTAASTDGKDTAAGVSRPLWFKPEVDVIDIEETKSGGGGNSDGAASHT